MEEYWEDEVESLDALEVEEVPDLEADWTDTWDDFESDAFEVTYGVDQDPVDPYCEEDWDDGELTLLEEGYFTDHDEFEPDWFEEE